MAADYMSTEWLKKYWKADFDLDRKTAVKNLGYSFDTSSDKFPASSGPAYL